MQDRTLVRVIYALEFMRDNGPVDTEHGICKNVGYMCGLSNIEVSRLLNLNVWNDWPHYSGDPVFPIPGGTMAYYDDNNKLWEGEQLEYRHSLINHIVSKLNVKLSQTKCI